MDLSNMEDVENKSDPRNEAVIPDSIKQQVRSSGLWICSMYDDVTSPPKMPSYDRSFHYYVFVHLLEGKAFYWNSQMEKEVGFTPGMGIVVTPGERVDYGGDNELFVEDSLCFMGPVADFLFQNKILKSGLYHFGKTRRLLPIIEKIREATIAAQLEANVMLQSLIFDLYNENRYKAKQNSKFSQIDLLKKEIQKDRSEWWTVKRMAEYCNVSDTHLRRLFREDMGVSPKAYIENVKMQQAIELLCCCHDKISDIALQLGYVDPYHFIRRFKHLVGLPPAQYRKKYGS